VVSTQSTTRYGVCLFFFFFFFLVEVTVRDAATGLNLRETERDAQPPPYNHGTDIGRWAGAVV
jgi:hypothetical protein